jgi:1,4-dihydroxy-2-naphthoate octaprenyltransferase
MALATVNNIPDYHQDRLVGKKNLVVRLGRKNGRYLYLALSGAGLSVIVLGAVLGVFPRAVLLAAIAGLPLWWASLKASRDTWDTPRLFVPAVMRIVQCYALTTTVFALAVAFGGMR